MMHRVLLIAVAGFSLVIGGCGGSNASSVTLDSTKACFEDSGYTTTDRPNLGLADVSADDWYEVRRGEDDLVVVAFFENSDAAARGKRFLTGITRTATEAFGIELTDSDIDALIRTSGNALYWWDGSNPSHEDDVERCMNP